MFSMTKIGRFVRGFSVVDFSAVGFVELLKTLKDLTPKITVPVQVWFSLAKQCISMVWFPNSWFYLSRKKCIVAMFSCFKKSEKFLQREVYLLVRCLILNGSRRHAFIYATKTWNLWVFLFVCLFFFFYSFSNVFQEKIYKKCSTGNEEWIESETALMQRDYVLHNHLNIS